MIDNTQTWYYEDFCTDISKFLAENSKDFIEYSVDPFTALAVINEDKLALVLSKFWHATE